MSSTSLEEVRAAVKAFNASAPSGSEKMPQDAETLQILMQSQAGRTYAETVNAHAELYLNKN